MELIMIICEGKRGGVSMGLWMYEKMNRMEETSPFEVCKRLSRVNYSAILEMA